MTKIMKVPEDEAMKMALEGNEIILGGVEVHVRFVRYKGDPGIALEFTPPYGKDDVPDWMADKIKSEVLNVAPRNRKAGTAIH
jgi:hypothetical protein